MTGSSTGRSRSASNLLVAVVIIFLWGYIVFRLGPLWQGNSDYGFGWFIPVLCACLFWERWKQKPPPGPIQLGSGTYFFLGLLSFVLLVAAQFLEVIPYWRFAGWVFAGAAIGITFILIHLLGGRSWTRRFAFPVLFFLIAVPWPTRIEAPIVAQMSNLNAIASTLAANVLGSPAVRHGIVIETSAGLVGVDEACSGIRSFQASIMIALFLGELFRYTLARRLLLVGGAITLALLCNIVRTTYLVRTSDLHGLQAVNLRHDQAGYVILLITMAGLLLITWLLRAKNQTCGGTRLKRESNADKLESLRLTAENCESAISPAICANADRSVTRFMKPALAGFVVWVVLVEVGIEFWYRLAEKKASSQSLWSLKLPTNLSEFQESTPSEQVRALLHYDEGTTASWRDAEGNPWQLHYFRWLPAQSRFRAAIACGEARGHAPDVCLRNMGMVVQTNLGANMMQFGTVRLRVLVERFLDRGRSFHVFSCYWEPNDWVPQAAPSTRAAAQAVLHALRTRDRGWNEKRVLKLGVWGMDEDAPALKAFSEIMSRMVSD